MLLKNVERIPLTIEEEAESLDTFLKTEKARRLSINPDIDEAELDKVLRVQWSGFNFATQRSYLSNKLAIFGLESAADVRSQLSEVYTLYFILMALLTSIAGPKLSIRSASTDNVIKMLVLLFERQS